jgi:hypothetical protein
MINNEVIRNCTAPFPVIQGLLNEHALGKILIKNIYQGWQGENIKQIKDKHENNPYSLRIGMPSTDDQLRSDAMYFILHYLSYNPITKSIEKRDLISYRNMERVYIGQSIDEKAHSDYRLFVDGNIIASDIYFKNQDANKNVSVNQLINNLIHRVEKLQAEVFDLKRQTKERHIYRQGT